MSRPTVAIIGAGASGALTALHILSNPQGPRIFLIEKRQGFGVGVAYSTGNADHLLNVRAGNMSAFPDQPAHFTDWLRDRDPDLLAAGFVPRRTYGAYLSGLLRAAAMSDRAAGRLMLVNDEATSLIIGEGRPRLRLAVGRELLIDALVLATGNGAPEPPHVPDGGLGASPRYIADPWAADAFRHVAPEDAVLLLGTGLTMVDVALTLKSIGHEGPKIAMSRRGLLPRRHAAPVAVPPDPLPPLPPVLSAALRIVRRHVKRYHEAQGDAADWRAVIDALRPVTRGFWQALDTPTRRRFMRHLRPWWDVHRHRLAPVVADRLTAMLESGEITLKAGRLRAFALEGTGARQQVAVQWRPRRGTADEALQVAHVVNCTGPGGDLSRNGPPIIRSLLAAGLARPDALGLGLDLDGDGRLIAADGCAGRFYALGPASRGAFWEVTAIPDIRVQAQQVAAAICRDLG